MKEHGNRSATAVAIPSLQFSLIWAVQAGQVQGFKYPGWEQGAFWIWTRGRLGLHLELVLFLRAVFGCRYFGNGER